MGIGMAVGKLGILGVDILLTVDRIECPCLERVVLSLETGLSSKSGRRGGGEREVSIALDEMRDR